MDYTPIIQAYIALVNQLVGSKVAENSIDPTDVASIGIELAELLSPILNTINDFAITGGTLPPDDVNGSDLDLYIQGGTSIIFWRKRNGIWVQEAEVPLGIQIVDGNISLQASVNEQIVTVSAGSWGINNIVYSKATQTQMTLTAADLNFNRIDTIVADTTGAIYLLDGVASSNPNPTVLPTNSIVVDYVFIPASSSGDLPYIADSNTSPASIIDDSVISGGKTWSSLKLNVIPQPWTISPTPINGVRWIEIDGVTYQFASTIEGNTSEPALNSSIAAWTDLGMDSFPPVWNGATTYSIGDWVYVNYSGVSYAYQSATNSNLNNLPPSGSSNSFWNFIGILRGTFPDSSPYNLHDIVYDEDTNSVYLSNVSDNTYDINEEVPVSSTWILLGTKAGGEPPLIFNQSNLVEESFGGAWYLLIPVPDGLTVVSIDYKIGTVTNRLSIDNAVTDTANTPNTRISGFPNNNTQTITIKLI